MVFEAHSAYNAGSGAATHLGPDGSLSPLVRHAVCAGKSANGMIPGKRSPCRDGVYGLFCFDHIGHNELRNKKIRYIVTETPMM
jgi:hypothetical protein